ncbi:hypothetical protein IWX47DRAFT_323835 [Phyllosticta citricarpa]
MAPLTSSSTYAKSKQISKQANEPKTLFQPSQHTHSRTDKHLLHQPDQSHRLDSTSRAPVARRPLNCRAVPRCRRQGDVSPFLRSLARASVVWRARGTFAARPAGVDCVDCLLRTVCEGEVNCGRRWRVRQRSMSESRAGGRKLSWSSVASGLANQGLGCEPLPGYPLCWSTFCFLERALSRAKTLSPSAIARPSTHSQASSPHYQPILPTHPAGEQSVTRVERQTIGYSVTPGRPVKAGSNLILKCCFYSIFRSPRATSSFNHFLLWLHATRLLVPVP